MQFLGKHSTLHENKPYQKRTHIKVFFLKSNLFFFNQDFGFFINRGLLRLMIDTSYNLFVNYSTFCEKGFKLEDWI